MAPGFYALSYLLMVEAARISIKEGLESPRARELSVLALRLQHQENV